MNLSIISGNIETYKRKVDNIGTHYMLVKIIISIVFGILGLAIGFPVFKLAKHQISVRDKQFPMLREDYPVDLLENKKSFAVFEICFFVTYFFSYFVLGENVVSLIFSLVLSTCCIDLSAVDLAIRRIPNQMLLIILIVGLANDIINPLIYGGSIKQNLVMSLIGIVVSFFIFYIPKLVGLYMGNGDVKLSAVFGFALGFVGYIQAMVVMAVISVLLLVVLIITKKGNGKTKTPMGPALSIGAVFTVLLPLLSNVIGDAPFSVL